MQTFKINAEQRNEPLYILECVDDSRVVFTTDDDWTAIKFSKDFNPYKLYAAVQWIGDTGSMRLIKHWEQFCDCGGGCDRCCLT